jgi:hypothetical protein
LADQCPRSAAHRANQGRSCGVGARRRKPGLEQQARRLVASHNRITTRNELTTPHASSKPSGWIDTSPNNCVTDASSMSLLLPLLLIAIE